MKAGHLQSAATVQGADRLARLDGLRGLAACGVAFAYHAQNLFVFGLFDGSGPLVLWFHLWGWTLVDLFFVISGFIFAHVYLRDDSLRRPGALSGFAAARIARLYPLHLATLLLMALLWWQAPENSALRFAAHLFMLQAFAGDVGHTFNGPSWSISVEAVCYVLFALGAWGGRRVLGWITSAALGLALAWFALVGQSGGPWSGEVLQRGLLGFFAGQLLWRHRAALGRIPAPLLAAVAAAGLLVDPARHSPVLWLGLLTWPALVLLALRLQLLETAPLLWLGERSYAIYLLHWPLIALSLDWLGPQGGSLWQVLAFHGAFIAATLLLSDLALRWLEYPARTAIRGWWAGRAKTAGAPASRRASAPTA